MKKVKTLLIILFSTLLLSGCSEFKPVIYGESEYEHVVIIGIDGAGHFVEQANTPNIDRIIASDCAFGYNYTSETPTLSAQNWASYLHGVSPDKHRVDNVKISVQRFTDNRYPSLFKILRKSFPNSNMVSIVNWAPINYGVIETGANVDKYPNPPRFSEPYCIYNDSQVADLAVEYLKENDTKLMFIQFDSIDSIGHGYGYGSQNHRDAISTVDSYIGNIYDACDDSTLFIIVADHGGTPGGTHGGSTPEETQITCIIHGKTVNPDGLTSFKPRDLAPIVLTALKITIPDNMDGQVPTELFNE